MVSKQESFIERWYKAAQAASQKSGIPASVILAQAALESGWGSSTLATTANNFFGIKAGTSWKGETISLYDSIEKSYSAYRVYPSALDSLTDWAESIVSQPRYAAAKAPSPYVAAYGLQAGGYATDPDYAKKLVGIIDQYNLQRFDKVTYKSYPNIIIYPEDPRFSYVEGFKQMVDSALKSGYKPDDSGRLSIPVYAPFLQESEFSRNLAWSALFKGEDYDTADIADTVDGGSGTQLNMLGEIVRFLLIMGAFVACMVFLIKMFPAVEAAAAKGV